MSVPEPILCSELDAPGIAHGFFTRAGGVSSGLYRGLNVGLGSRDNRNDVLENRRRVASTLGVAPEALTTACQVHSADIIEVNNPWPTDDKPKVDGLVTSEPGIAICVLVADCGPVLFADRKNRIIGAAHAGWKGATSGVLENTIATMESLGAERDVLTAVLGPTISQANYEVGPELVERLLSLSRDNERFLAPSVNALHAMFDLPGYIVNRLYLAGVKGYWTGHCNYADEDRFYSYRRATQRGETDYGRQIAGIAIHK